MSECNFNLAQLDTLSQFDHELSGFLKRKFAASHDDFVKQLYVDLDDAMYVLETQNICIKHSSGVKMSSHQLLLLF